MCLHENDLETVESVKVNHGVLTAHWNPLYLIGKGEEGIEDKGGHLVVKCSETEM